MVKRIKKKTYYVPGDVDPRQDDEDTTTDDLRYENYIKRELVKLMHIKKYHKENAFAIAHNFPELYLPKRMPDFYQFPTKVVSPPLHRTVLCDSTGKFAIFWNPLASTWDHAAATTTGVDVTWDSDALIWYADNDGNAVDSALATGSPYDTNLDQFNKVGTWPKNITGFDSSTNFRKTRLLGAYLKMSYIGKSEDFSGYVRTVMGLRSFSHPLNAEAISKTDLINFPTYHTATLAEPLLLRYKIVDDTFFDFGPYSPYESVPFFLVIGEGFQPNAPILVQGVRDFEGIVLPNFSEFAGEKKVKPGQVSLEQQKKNVRQSDTIVSGGFFNKIREKLNIDEYIINQINNLMQNFTLNIDPSQVENFYENVAELIRGGRMNLAA